MRLAIYTAVAGDHDELIDPAVVSPDCDYICFADNPRAYRSEVWEIRPLALYGDDPVRTAKQPKLLPHVFLPDHEWSVWVDANLAIVGDLGAFARQTLAEHSLAFYEHPEGRSCVYEEADTCIRLGKDDPLVLGEQIAAYDAEGYPRDNGMMAGMCIFRQHHEPGVALLMKAWWEEIVRRSRRDQVSFPYVAWKHGTPFHLIHENVRDNAYLNYRFHKTRLEREKQARRIGNADAVVVSFPKSGRTWLRYFLGRYVERAFGQPFSLDLPRSEDTPAVLFTHSSFDNHQDGIGDGEIVHLDLLEKKTLIALVRDPRDVAVSYFHQKRDRERVFDGDLDAFVRSPIYGVERQSRFVLRLLDAFDAHPGPKQRLSYEDLHRQPEAAFRALAELLYGSLDEAAFQSALGQSSFDAMQSFELELTREGRTDSVFHRLGVQAWDGNREALKVRQGKLRGFSAELGESTLDRMRSLPATTQLIERLGLEP